jgi:magnesium chelatase accessory protein
MSDRLNWDKDGASWPNRQHSQMINAGGLRWHVQVMGQGPVLLLLHGTGASSHSWRDLMPELAKRFTLVVPDLPGHGFTAMPTGDGLSLLGMARLLGALLVELDMHPKIIVGHSAGVAIALRMTLDGLAAPEFVISINGALLPFGGVAAQLFPGIARLLVINPFVAGLMAWRGGDLAAVTRLLEGTGSKINPEGLDLYRTLFGNRGHVDATLRMMANWDLNALQRDLGKVKTPVLLLAAERDKAVTPETTREIRTKLPDARFRLLPGLGHLAHEERPADMTSLIVEVAVAAGVVVA